MIDFLYNMLASEKGSYFYVRKLLAEDNKFVSACAKWIQVGVWQPGGHAAGLPPLLFRCRWLETTTTGISHVSKERIQHGNLASMLQNILPELVTTLSTFLPTCWFCFMAIAMTIQTTAYIAPMNTVHKMIRMAALDCKHKQL